MTYIIITFLISTVLILYSCGSSENQSAGDRDSTDAVPQALRDRNDTIPLVSPPGQGLPPGQVRAEAVAFTIAPTSNQPDSVRTLRLRIRSVLEYGPATPPIPPGDTLVIPVKENRRNIPENVKDGAVIRVRLQHNISSKDRDSGPAWSLINIEK